MRVRDNVIEWIWCAMFLLVAMCTITNGKVLYVDAQASGTNDGTSWVNAFNYLQDALITAQAGDEVRVAKGTYKPNEGTIPVPPPIRRRSAVSELTDAGTLPADLGQEATFQIKSGVTVKGDYVGTTGDDPNSRNIELYETILSGDLNGDDVSVEDSWDLVFESSRSENSYHVVTTDSNIILDGFVVTGGNAISQTGDLGGGMVMLGEDPSIMNCRFISNSAFEGGAVRCYSSRPKFENCTFSSNAAINEGGGLLIFGLEALVVDCDFVSNSASKGAAFYSNGSSVTLKGCEFTDNKVSDIGAGVYLEVSEAALDDCEFVGNQALVSGGGLFSVSSDLILTKCIFSGNCAQYGGGMDSEGEGSSGELSDCVFTRNSALLGGGLMTISGGNMELRNCSFTYNSAVRRGMGGTGVRTTTTEVPAGGGLYISNLDVKLEDCVFTGNSADNGGALLVESQESVFNGCLFDGNKAQVAGGAVYGSTVDMVLTQCTFFCNSAPDGNALACIYPRTRGGVQRTSVTITNSILWDGGNEFGSSVRAIVSVNYSNVQGGCEGVGNIEEDPCFAQLGFWDPNGTLDDPNDDFWVDGDYHLKSQAGRWHSATQSWVHDDVTSPCIDSGDPASPIGHEPFPNGGIVNMGAYGGTVEASKSYFIGPVCETIVAGDINGDCKVDFLDLAILASHWSWREASIYKEPPIVVITEPADGDMLVMNDPNRPLLLRAEASDIDGSVVSVDFLIGWRSGYYGLGGTYRGQQDANGWYYQWYWSKVSQQPMPGSSITIVAKAMDNDGSVIVSPEVVITAVSQ